MLQIFLTTAYIASQDPSMMQLAVNENKTPQSIEEINADLRAKKESLEPFDQKKVKVDIESLGLDDIDRKPSAESEISKIKEAVDEKVKEEIKKEEPKEDKKEEVKKNKEEEKAKNDDLSKNSLGGIVSKIKNFVNKKIDKKIIPDSKKDVKKIEEDIDDSKKSGKAKNSKKQSNKISKKKNEISQKEKLKKLIELRKKYLTEISVEENESSDNFESDENSEKIIPRKKDINKFLTEEPPAVPLLNRFRTADNRHIPLILTRREKIGILFNAISSGDASFFDAAYKNIQDPNVTNQSGDTALTYALLLRKHGPIAYLLATGADPNMPNKLGYTPIDIAIELLDSRSLDFLIKNKADVSYVDSFGRTYLMHAARVGFLPAVEMFVNAGLDVNAMDNDGFTSLSIAYRHKKEIVVKYLLAHGAKTWIEKPYDPEKQSLIKELENRWK